MEKVNEVQAHGLALERMCLSYDNAFLFSAGADGTLMLHEVKDRDPRGLVTRKLDYGAITTFSEEIQTEKTEMD